MNQNEENKSNMYNAVDAVLKSNASIVAEVPALGEVHNDLEVLIGEIDVKNKELLKVREGKTSVKRQAIEELIASIVPVANATKAHAVRKNKIELKALTDFSERQFKRLSHADLPIKVKNIKDAAQGVIADLANYGMTQADLDLVEEKLESLKASVENKDTGFTDHVALRTALYGLFDSADDLLNEEADAIVEVLKKKKLDFYNQYFAARVVKDLGGGRGGGDNPEEPPAPPEEPK